MNTTHVGYDVTSIATIDVIIGDGSDVIAGKEEVNYPLIAVATITVIACLMLGILALSFIRYHRKVRGISKKHKEYIKTTNSFQKRRIGAPSSLTLASITSKPTSTTTPAPAYPEIIATLATNEDVSLDLEGSGIDIGMDDEEGVQFIDTSPVLTVHYRHSISQESSQPLLPKVITS